MGGGGRLRGGGRGAGDGAADEQGGGEGSDADDPWGDSHDPRMTRVEVDVSTSSAVNFPEVNHLPGLLTNTLAINRRIPDGRQ
ncbi:hypothetical protein GCM10012286_17190 [Streptomyces lasiicapitis]|uniref:Uncharacterized protein n=1 Tax=Streptomyces lasiicapitis TaxID=1923961 RepID=A0ABQ2LM29_9ACTN|nr:hypothetical protein GCM10012286_17190 [Streptomyces lasiicapitis]